MNDNHFFIVGAGRSGTTLLRSMFSAHSRLAVAPETHFMKRVEEEGPLQGGTREFEDMWQRLVNWVRFQDLGIDSTECRSRIERSGDHSYRNIFDTMLSMYGQMLDKPVVGEKTPGHARYLDQLLTWFPRSKIIVLQRDPRAVIASQLKTPWVTKNITTRGLEQGLFSRNRLNAVTTYADDWRQLYLEILPPWLDDARVSLWKYEDMIADPEKVIRSICAFLGELFEPDMLADRSEADAPRAQGLVKDAALDEWREKHHAKSSKSISLSSLEKWRAELSKMEVATIEQRCREPMRRAGYEVESSPAKRVVFNTMTKVHNNLGRFEERIRSRDRQIEEKAAAPDKSLSV